LVAAVAFDKRLLLIGNVDPDKLGFREVQHLNKGEMTRSSIILLFCHFPILISPSSVNVWLQSGNFYQLFQNKHIPRGKYQANWHQALKSLI